MRRILHICVNDCLLIVRDKSFLIWSLLLPLVFVFVFAKAFAGSSQPEKSYLAVLNRDQGPYGAYLIEKLKRPGMEIDVMDREPEKASKLLVIPADFSAKIVIKESQALELRVRAGANVDAAAQAEVTIYQAVISLLAEIVLHPDSDTFFTARKEFSNLVLVKRSFPENTLVSIPSGFDHQVPGTLVNFLLMNTLISGGITLLIERKRRLLERVLYSPISAAQLWLGKFSGRLLVALIQAAILLAAGRLLFRFRLGGIWLAGLIVFFFALAVTAISLFLGAVLKKEEMLVGVSVLVANVLAALGGCWWPMEIVGKTFRAAGMLFPTWWAMDGFHKIVFFNRGLSSLMPGFFVLLAYAVLFSLLSFRYFKIRD